MPIVSFPASELFTDKTDSKPVTVSYDENIDLVVPIVLPGRKEVVDYYNRIKTITSDEVGFDSAGSLTDVMFDKVNAAILYVTEEFNIVTDSATNLRATAFVDIGLIPQIGDIIVTNIASRDVMLIVISAIKKSPDLYSTFEIVLKVDSYIADSMDRYKSLLARVNKEYIYNTEPLSENRLLEVNNYELVTRLKDIEYSLQDYINSRYYDAELYGYKYQLNNNTFVIDKHFDRVMSYLNIKRDIFTFCIKDHINLLDSNTSIYIAIIKDSSAPISKVRSTMMSVDYILFIVYKIEGRYVLLEEWEDKDSKNVFIYPFYEGSHFRDVDTLGGNETYMSMYTNGIGNLDALESIINEKNKLTMHDLLLIITLIHRERIRYVSKHSSTRD